VGRVDDGIGGESDDVCPTRLVRIQIDLRATSYMQ